VRIVSLFSGAGGLDLGLIQAGHNIIWANDIFIDAAATYRLNIGDHIDTRSICDIKSEEIPDCDVVVGGFPCQGYSVANSGRSATDPRNQLYKELVRVVMAKKPLYFVAENVKGLASLGKGAILQAIISEFRDCGYRVNHEVVNAADYGVPQSRKRIIITGIRNDLPEILLRLVSTHADPTIAPQFGLEPWRTVGAALAHFPEPEDGKHIYNHECSKYKLRFNGHMGHRYIDPYRPSPTVTARGDERGGVVVLHHPNNHRRMTARELAAVQNFPDDFKFIGTKTSAYRQIANAVPVALGRAIGTMLGDAAEILDRSQKMNVL
jgi:DNA (cytosine-5)-methyltransferase 1